MAQPAIRFEDGAAYEQGMAPWSRLAGEVFLQWLTPEAGLRWIDVGCGNGAFTELLMQRCAPAEVQGIDPSEAQISFAQNRPGARDAVFQLGDAMALPFGENRFDAASMALVIFFVPDPVVAVREMARVVRPGGMIGAYAWDALGGGMPFAPIQAELRASGVVPPLPPSADASRMDAMRDLWSGAGLESVETREITVQRTFEDFEDFWSRSTTGGGIRPTLAALTSDDTERIKERVRARLPADATGRISYSSRANAVKGCVPRP